MQHRTKLKVILNPIFRKLGFSIVSKFSNGEFLGYALRPYPKCCPVIRTSEDVIQNSLDGKQVDNDKVDANRSMASLNDRTPLIGD